MLDKLLSGTAGFVQTNLTMIGNSYPVTVVKDRVRDMIGWKTNQTDDTEDIGITDTFDDAPTPKSSDYIPIYSMIIRAANGEKIPIYRWVLFGLGIMIMGVTIMLVTNHMIMLPWSIRLFAALYIINIGIFTDFTQLNLIYFVLLGYMGLFLYRAYLQTTDPTLNIVPFHTFAFMPLRTKKNNWTDIPNSLWSYLHIGADGLDYNALVKSTEEYMNAEKAAVPDYDELAGKFGLEPLYESFENHMINMNLPGFMPPPPDTSIQDAQKVIDAASKVKTVANATNLLKEIKPVQDVSKSLKVITEARKMVGKALNKDVLAPGVREQLQEAKRTLNQATKVVAQIKESSQPKPVAI